jgi:predicted TIM-barrel fold metal-dependent hydrolase
MPEAAAAPAVIDSHVHVIAPDADAYPLQPLPLATAWYREAPCSAEELLVQMDAAGVARAILVQPLGAYSYDNRYTADSALLHAERFTSVCCVDANGPDPVGALTHWVRERGMRGVRLFALAREGPSWLEDPRTFPLWECAARLEAPVVVTIFAHQIPALARVLRRFPETPVALDHCAFSELRREPWPEAAPLFALADFPNLHLKVSTHVLDAAAREGDSKHFVAALVRRFGAERVMWGSDFCQTHDRSYAELVRLGREAFSGLSAAEQARCLGGTAAALWP